MDGAEALTTVAQIAVGLAGFAGIAIAFNRRPGELTALEGYRLILLFATSFGALFLALLPFGLQLLGMPAPALWRLSSALFVGFDLLLLGCLTRPTLRFLRDVREIFNLRVLTGLLAGHVAAIGLLSASAVGAFPGRESGLFLCALLWLLFHSAVQFARILFIRPLS